MSSVIERYRKISQMEFFRNAVELRDDMTKFLMREKNVPRKYRALAAYPITDKFEELFSQIKAANGVYTDTPEKVEQRKAEQQKCLFIVDDIYWALQRTVSLLWKDKLKSRNQTADQTRLRNALNDFALRLKREEDLLSGWRNSSRLYKRKSSK